MIPVVVAQVPGSRMSPIPDFAAKLDLLMKALSISRGRLAQESGLDKSLISRWVAGRVSPLALNLERVTVALARRRPGFTMLDWDRPLAEFARQFGGSDTPAALASGTRALPLHDDVLTPARAETARRGERYEGFYWIYRRSFGRPGRQGRLAVWIHQRDGLLELREAAPGFEYRGWGVLLQNRLYCTFTEEGTEVMAFMIVNAARAPHSQVLHAIFLGAASDGQLTPKAAPAALVRVGDLSGDTAQDEATWRALAATGGDVRQDEVPPAVQAYLDRDFGPAAHAKGGPDMVTAPPSDDD